MLSVLIRHTCDATFRGVADNGDEKNKKEWQENARGDSQKAKSTSPDEIVPINYRRF